MLKNIKLFCNKERFRKIKLTIFPFIMSTVLLTGCNTRSSSGNENSSNTHYEVESLTEVSEEDIKNSIEQSLTNYIDDSKFVELPDSTFNELDTYINISEEEIANLNDKIDDSVDYKYSEYFEVEKALDRYDQLVEASTFSDKIITNNIVDSNKLYNIILNNNKTYIKEGVNSKTYTEFSKEELMEICNIISGALNKKIEELSIDINELDSVLCSLKILSYTKYEYAAITTDNCLAINKSMINTLSIENALEKIIAHESMHLIQKSSQEEQELEGYSKNDGMNYKWKELNVNSLYNDWLIEASAEKSAASITGEEVNYAKKISYLDALEIVMAFDDVTISNLDLSKDLDKFYEFFSCNGIISREEIATMMYAIDFINTEDLVTSSENEFLAYYKEKTGVELSFKDTQDLKKTYMGTIYKTLSKKLYYELIQKLNNGSIKVTDAFSMIVLFETSCSKNTWYSVDERLPYNEDFINEYCELQDTFFEIVSNKLNMSKEGVQIAYNSYSCYDIIIDFTNKNNTLNNIYNKIKQNKTISINQVYNNLLSNKNIK